MRITHETLLKIAQDTVTQEVRAARDVIAAYLCGSLLGSDYLFGGTTDVDLVFIHGSAPPQPRVVVPLSDEIHLDLIHHEQRLYRDARALRVHPWLGPTLNAARALYDPRHFLDFVQAGVRGQFERADFTYQRARTAYEEARRLWFTLQTRSGEPSLAEVNTYLEALEHAANAIALLSGPPLSERRFLPLLAQRAAALERPGLYAGLMGLLGAPRAERRALESWVQAWLEGLKALPEGQAPIPLQPPRWLYYYSALEALLASEQPANALWPLLRTWVQAAPYLAPQSSPRVALNEALGQLGLSGAAFAERLHALDTYLDTLDETLETWAQANGV